MATDVNIETLLNFPSEMPRITSAAWLNDKNILATGHYDGHFIIWDKSSKKSVFRADYSYEIETISVGEDNRIILGNHSGDVYLVEVGKNYQTTKLLSGNDDRFSRTWRLNWIDKHSFVRTSTYGNVGIFEEKDNEWHYNQLPRIHTDSVFSVDTNDDLIITGDWAGKVVIWKKSENGYDEKGRIMLSSSVEDIILRSNSSFAAVTEQGHVYYVEQDQQTADWYIAFDVFLSPDRGTSVTYSTIKNMFIATTQNEIIQLDLSTQQVQQIPIKGSIIARENSPGAIDLITQKGAFRLPIEDITAPPEFVKYKFAKISLLGRTGVGKSTLCDTILGNSQFDEQSTFGKKIWEWELGYSEDEENIQEKLVFHDHGGQESEMFTFIPYISDSSTVMLLFKRPDLRSLEVIEDSLPNVLMNTNENTKFFLVETFIDQEKNDVPDKRIDDLLGKYSILELLKVSSKTNQNVDELKNKLKSTINWNKARVVFESIESNNVMKMLLDLQEEGVYVKTLDELRIAYRERYSKEISKTHLRFLVSNYSTQGIVEYYPQVSDFVVFGGPPFQKLRSDIPTYANLREGFVTIKDVAVQTGGNLELLKVIDALFEKTGVHIKCGDYRIYPKFLPDKSLKVDRVEWSYNSGDVRSKKYALQSEDQVLLIKALSDLDLTCYGVTKGSGLFGWEKNAFVYYNVQAVNDLLTEEYLSVNYVIGGEKKELMERLTRKFEAILQGVYGPEFLYRSGDQEDQKKNSYEHEIVITYASEQEIYVANVCKSLKNKGIDTWCAPFEKNDMWGTDLNKFLKSMYFSKGRLCLMFISDDYVKKVWPQLETRAALSRQLQEEIYLLPVRFEHTEVPGLNPDLFFYWNWDYTPTELADEVQQKLEKIKNS